VDDVFGLIVTVWLTANIFILSDYL